MSTTEILTRPVKPATPRPLPEPNGDFYHLEDVLNEDEKKILANVRAFMKTKVAPVINKHWADASFPFELVAGVRDLNIVGGGMQGYGLSGGSTLLNGFVAMEMAKVDAS